MKKRSKNKAKIAFDYALANAAGLPGDVKELGGLVVPALKKIPFPTTRKILDKMGYGDDPVHGMESVAAFAGAIVPHIIAAIITRGRSASSSLLLARTFGLGKKTISGLSKIRSAYSAGKLSKESLLKAVTEKVLNSNVAKSARGASFSSTKEYIRNTVRPENIREYGKNIAEKTYKDPSFRNVAIPIAAGATVAGVTDSPEAGAITTGVTGAVRAGIQRAARGAGKEAQEAVAAGVNPKYAPVAGLDDRKLRDAFSGKVVPQKMLDNLKDTYNGLYRNVERVVGKQQLSDAARSDVLDAIFNVAETPMPASVSRKFRKEITGIATKFADSERSVTVKDALEARRTLNELVFGTSVGYTNPPPSLRRSFGRVSSSISMALKSELRDTPAVSQLKLADNLFSKAETIRDITGKTRVKNISAPVLSTDPVTIAAKKGAEAGVNVAAGRIRSARADSAVRPKISWKKDALTGGLALVPRATVQLLDSGEEEYIDEDVPEFYESVYGF